jgi:U3 small nucleolar RNA-associated protein 7
MVEKKFREGAVAAAEAEILDTTEGGFIEAEGEMERTYKVKMGEIKDSVDEQVRL